MGAQMTRAYGAGRKVTDCVTGSFASSALRAKSHGSPTPAKVTSKVAQRLERLVIARAPPPLPSTDRPYIVAWLRSNTRRARRLFSERTTVGWLLEREQPGTGEQRECRCQGRRDREEPSVRRPGDLPAPHPDLPGHPAGGGREMEGLEHEDECGRSGVHRAGACRRASARW